MNRITLKNPPGFDGFSFGCVGAVISFEALSFLTTTRLGLVRFLWGRFQAGELCPADTFPAMSTLERYDHVAAHPAILFQDFAGIVLGSR